MATLVFEWSWRVEVGELKSEFRLTVRLSYDSTLGLIISRVAHAIVLAESGSGRWGNKVGLSQQTFRQSHCFVPARSQLFGDFASALPDRLFLAQGVVGA